ncbi:MAG: MerR family transcriptional regulator [Pseudomonadota bacterium]|nr:MerR family transcriptional regulator [Pseudomonadota bacterium]MEE3101234.1 MerR family transcriptional regulator [Pseudomonadota bacterium]
MTDQLAPYDSDPPAPGLRSMSWMVDKFDVSARALRFYEYKGLISPLRDGVRRRFTPADVDRLREILRLKSCGATLDEIYALQQVRVAGEPAAIRAAERALAETLAPRARQRFADASAQLDALGEWRGELGLSARAGQSGEAA